MNLVCGCFGHVVPKGYADAPPYGRVSGGWTDGIGREHWRLEVRCERCDQYFHLASFHGPLK